MKGSKKSAILAIFLMAGGVLAIISIAQSQQAVRLGTLSLGITISVTHLSAPPATDSSNDVNHYYNFICRLFENAVLGLHSACTFAYYLSTPASQNTSSSVVRLDDLNGGVALDFKNTVIFASNCVARNSLIHADTRAIGFDEDKINFRGITFFIDYCLIYRSARNK